MVKKLLFFIISWLVTVSVYGQPYLTQYFEGSSSPALKIHFDTTNAANIWQIGRPQKVIFDSAATLPNALVTDTVNTYPMGDSSRFFLKFRGSDLGNVWGVLAMRWKQKLDLDTNHDGGLIEYSTDSGKNWHSVFNSPYTYSFYGFKPENQDTLATGEYAFSGTDTNWADIWLCFDNSYMTHFDSIYFRFTLKSDSTDNAREGWMIDNFMVMKTLVHTVKKMEAGEYMRVYPTRTTGRLNIEAEKLQEYHVIENMQLVDLSGRVVEKYGLSPTKFYIDISKHPPGMYYLKVKTNKRSMTFPVELYQ